MVILPSFIRLSDYLIVNTMHVLCVNSVATLLNYLEEQLQHTTPLSDVLVPHPEGEEKADNNSLMEVSFDAQKSVLNKCCPYHVQKLQY